MHFIEKLIRDTINLSSAKKTGTEEGQMLLLCPFHEDTSPSFSLNLNSGLWQCKAAGCPTNQEGNGGDTARLISLAKEISITEAREIVSDARGTYMADNPVISTATKARAKAKKDKFPISEEQIALWTDTLLKSSKPLTFLKEKCLFTEETIRKFELGFNGKRITIPVRSAGELVNVRQYASKPTNGHKLLNVTGFGEMRLFPEAALQGERIYFMEGEKDCILATQLGLNALTVTSGAGAFNKEWLSLFREKEVYICYDIDDAGKQGADKLSSLISCVTIKTCIIDLPITEPSNGDFTDYILAGNTIEQFHELCRTARVISYEPPQPLPDDIPAEVLEATLYEATYDPKFHQKRVQFTAIATGRGQEVYSIPRTFKVACDKSFGKACLTCPLNTGGLDTFVMEPTHPALLGLLDTTDTTIRNFLIKLFKLPPKCDVFRQVKIDQTYVETLAIIPAIGSGSKYLTRPLFTLGMNLDTNRPYTIEAVSTNDPQNQELAFVAYKATPLKSSLDEFVLTDELKTDLKTFQCGELSIADKLKDIYDDLSHNVTQIYGRDNLHLAIDLVYHSVLSFNLGNQPLKKGYVETLIIGDTRCGKTAVATGLIRHYQLGELASGESAKFTGLVGGVEQVFGRWVIQWGKIPLNHGRLLVIDEVSGLAKEDIEKMSQIRSDGFVEIVKIRTEKTTAQTRLIWMSNPRQAMSLHDYDSGPPIISNVIGKNEDIARFDFALLLDRDDVDTAEIDNKVFALPGARPTVYTSELCKNLVLWAWSRKADQVILPMETVKACVEYAQALCRKYSADCTIVYPLEQKNKMARLATALACRLFSTLDGVNVLVLPEHVKFIFDYLQSIYDAPVFAFDEWSLERRSGGLVMGPELATIMRDCGVEGLRLLQTSQYVRSEDINTALGGNQRETGNQYFSTLLKLQAVRRYHSYYVKTEGFIRIIKQYLKDPSIVNPFINEARQEI